MSLEASHCVAAASIHSSPHNTYCRLLRLGPCARMTWLHYCICLLADVPLWPQTNSSMDASAMAPCGRQASARSWQCMWLNRSWLSRFWGRRASIQCDRTCPPGRITGISGAMALGSWQREYSLHTHTHTQAHAVVAFGSLMFGNTPTRKQRGKSQFQKGFDLSAWPMHDR